MSAFYSIRDETTTPEVALVVLAGEIDFVISDELRTLLFGHVRHGCRRLLVDLTDTTFIDSTAIGVLVGAMARLDRAGGELLLVCPEREHHTRIAGGEPNRVRQILHITGIDAGVRICRTREEALLEAAVAG